MLKDFREEAFDVLIVAGQSNAEGNGVGSVEDPYYPDDRVWCLDRSFVISIAAENVLGNETRGDFALPFARAYIRAGLLKQSRKLLILRTAVGGSGFLDNHWKPQDDYCRCMFRLTRTALDMNPENRLVGLLWHQGESDAQLNASYLVHYAHLMTFIRAVRTEFCVPDLPFIAGDFVHHWKNRNEDICEPVVHAIRDVCRDCGHGAFVETDGLLSNVQETGRKTQICTVMMLDDVHFSRRSLYELAERYFAAYCFITNRRGEQSGHERNAAE